MLCSNGAASNLSSTTASKVCTDATHTTPGTPIYPNGAPRDIAHQYASNGGASGAVGPTTATYFFSNRGEFRTQSIVATDFALNYELPVHNFAFFAKAEVRNVFNHKAVVQNGCATTVLTNQNTVPVTVNGVTTNQVRFAAFNPFTQTPIQCTT